MPDIAATAKTAGKWVVAKTKETRKTIWSYLKKDPFMIILAVIVIALGLALIFCPFLFPASGAAVGAFFAPVMSVASAIKLLCVVGGGLVTGGMYALHQALFNPNVTWKTFAKEFGKGFVIGIVTSAYSVAASSALDAMFPVVSSYLGVVGAKAYMVVLSGIFGSLCGLASCVVSNVVNGKRGMAIFDNWKVALLSGFAIGFFCGFLQYELSAQAAANIQNTALGHVDEGIRDAVVGIKWKEIFEAIVRAPTVVVQHVQAAVLSAKWGTIENAVRAEATNNIRKEAPTPIREPQERSKAKPATVSDSSSKPNAGDQPSQETPRAARNLNDEYVAATRPENLDNNRQMPNDQQNQQANEPVEEVDEVNVPDDAAVAHAADAPEAVADENVGNSSEPHIDTRENLEDLAHPDPATVVEEYQDDRIRSQPTENDHVAVHPQEQEEQQMPDPSPVAAVQSNSSDSFDPHSGSSSIASGLASRQMSHVEQIPYPTRLTHDARKTYDSTRRESEVVHKLKIEAAQTKFSNVEFNDETYVDNKLQVLTLHQNQNTQIREANRKEQEIESLNPVYVSNQGGTRLGGPSNAQEPSSSGRENDRPSQRTGGEQNSLPSNFSVDPTPIKQQRVLPNGKKTATVHRLVAPDKNSNYKLTDRETEWPEFTGNMHVVGLMGARHCGKTILAQTILFELGYTISEKDATLTRLPIGIHAYVLHDDSLIIVECCEGIDPKEDSVSSSPYGALLLEIFMYLFCTRLIYVLPYISNSVEAIKLCGRRRISMLMTMTKVLQCVRRQRIDFVLRLVQDNHDYSQDLKELRHYFSQPQRRYLEGEIVEELTPDELEMDDIQLINKITVNMLRKFELDDSVDQTETYDRQLNDIIKNMELAANDETVVSGGYNDQPIDCVRFCGSMKGIWDMLAESTCLENTIANIRSKEVQDQPGEDHPHGVATTKFFSDAKSFVDKSNDSKIKREYEEYKREVNRKTEEVKKLPEEKRTPELFVDFVLKLADLVLRYSLEISNSQLKEKGITIGLNGFIIFVKACKSSTIELTALRMALFDYKIMGALTRPEIFNHHQNCWFLLIRYAHSGFRFHLLRFDLWSAANTHLKKEELKAGYEADIYLGIHRFLEELTDADPSRCVPEMNRQINIFFGGDIPFERIARLFEEDATGRIFDMVTSALRDLSSTEAKYNEWIALAEKWFDESQYAAVPFESEEQRKKEKEQLLGTLMCRSFVILYRIIAETYSKEVIKRSDDFVTRKFEERNAEIEKMRLLMWKNIADNAKQNKELFFSLMRTNLFDFLVQEYISNPKNLDNFPEALNTLGAIIGTEQCYEQDEEVQEYIKDKCRPAELRNRSNIHTMDEIRLRDQRYELTERWNLTRLRCLESGVVEKLISYFIERRNPQGVQYLLSALVTYLVSGRNAEEKKLSENIYLNRRHELVKHIVAEMSVSAKIIKDMKEETDEMNAVHRKHLTILKSGCQFINLLLAIYYNDKSRKSHSTFFEQDPPRGTFPLIASAAGELFDIFTSPLLTACSENEKKMHAYAKHHYLNMVLNLGSLSQTDISSILIDNGLRNYGTLAYTADPIKITHTEKEFVKLKMDTKHQYDHKLVVVGADLLARQTSVEQGFHVIHNTLTVQIDKLQMDFVKWKNESESYDRWVQRENTLRDRNIREATRRSVLPEPELAAAAISARVVKYAIPDVPYCTRGYSHHWTGKPSYEDIKCIRREFHHDGAFDAYTFHVLNPVQQKRKEFESILKFLEKLTESKDKPFKLKQARSNVTRMCEFVHFDVFLANCGYYVENGYYVTDEDKFQSEYALIFYEQLKALDEKEVTVILNSRFSKVEKRTDWGDHLLPLGFFDSNHSNYKFHSTLPIKELLRRRPHRNGVPSQLRYILVHVTHEDSGDCYQAVFTPEAKISHVRDQLKCWRVNSIYKEKEKDLDDEKHLRGIGGFMIQLKGH